MTIIFLKKFFELIIKNCKNLDFFVEIVYDIKQEKGEKNG